MLATHSHFLENPRTPPISMIQVHSFSEPILKYVLKFLHVFKIQIERLFNILHHFINFFKETMIISSCYHLAFLSAAETITNYNFHCWNLLKIHILSIGS